MVGFAGAGGGLIGAAVVDHADSVQHRSNGALSSTHYWAPQPKLGPNASVPLNQGPQPIFDYRAVSANAFEVSVTNLQKKGSLGIPLLVTLPEWRENGSPGVSGDGIVSHTALSWSEVPGKDNGNLQPPQGKEDFATIDVGAGQTVTVLVTVDANVLKQSQGCITIGTLPGGDWTSQPSIDSAEGACVQ